MSNFNFVSDSSLARAVCKADRLVVSNVSERRRHEDQNPVLPTNRQAGTRTSRKPLAHHAFQRTARCKSATRS